MFLPCSVRLLIKVKRVLLYMMCGQNYTYNGYKTHVSVLKVVKCLRFLCNSYICSDRKSGR